MATATQKTRGKKKRGKKAKKGGLTAATADRHWLYEHSVQEPEADVEFMDRVFKRIRGRKAISLREDFCGTGYLSCEWVKSHKDRSAVGLDLDKPTLEYGMNKHVAALGDSGKRVRLLKGDVLDGHPEKVDIVAAFNFSYWCFHDRATMLKYFKKVLKGIKKDGVFALDMYGGPDAQVEVEEENEKDGFDYVWDQCEMDAINNLAKRHIHFRFPDGTELKKAFEYDWRIWSLPEIRDVLFDAGFKQVDVYWEGADKNGEGNGVFRKRKSAPNEEAWIAYVMAWPDKLD